MKTFLTAILSIALSVAAQFSLKTGMASPSVKAIQEQPDLLRTLFTTLTNKYIFSGFMLYGLGALIWLTVLSKWDVSKAYPLVGLGFVFTIAIGFLLGEHVTVVRAFGVVMIISGVFLVGQS